MRNLIGSSAPADHAGLLRTLRQRRHHDGGAPAFEADVARLRAITDIELARLAVHTRLPLGTGIQITRESDAPLLAAIKSGSLLVVGEPGAGKTGALVHAAAIGRQAKDPDYRCAGRCPRRTVGGCIRRPHRGCPATSLPAPRWEPHALSRSSRGQCAVAQVLIENVRNMVSMLPMWRSTARSPRRGRARWRSRGKCPEILIDLPCPTRSAGGEPAHPRPTGRLCDVRGGDPAPDRAGVGDGAAAVDRFDPRHAQRAAVRDIVGAIDVDLSSEDLRLIDAAFAGVTVEGGRMNVEQMKVVDRDG